MAERKTIRLKPMVDFMIRVAREMVKRKFSFDEAMLIVFTEVSASGSVCDYRSVVEKLLRDSTGPWRINKRMPYESVLSLVEHQDTDTAFKLVHILTELIYRLDNGQSFDNILFAVIEAFFGVGWGQVIKELIDGTLKYEVMGESENAEPIPMGELVTVDTLDAPEDSKIAMMKGLNMGGKSDVIVVLDALRGATLTQADQDDLNVILKKTEAMVKILAKILVETQFNVILPSAINMAIENSEITREEILELIKNEIDSRKRP